MSQKRYQAGGDGSSSSSTEDKRRRVPALRNVVLEVMKLHSVQNMMEPILEPLIRRVVKEEVEVALKKHLTSMKRNCGTEIHPSEGRGLQLQFINSISLPVFTGTRIEGEECSSLKVALVDALMGQIIDSGQESSSKVEIVVLEGDFDGDEGDDWTHEEFKNNIVREREGKKPLLTGEVTLNLKEGTGLVGDISFTDNSSWTRSRKFRLGARVLDNGDSFRTREAKTDSFIVRDHRGELYKKHHPPSLFDDVWRLEKIGKDGAFHKRLSRENIKTVKDFLTLLFIDASRLRNILGAGMSAKMWEVTLEHARTCILDKKMYIYWSPGSEQKSGLVFNVVGQILGVLTECQFVPIDKLSDTEKVDAHNLLISAFQHWKEVLSFDQETSLLGGSLHVTDVLHPSNSPTGESSNPNTSMTAHKISGFDYTNLIPATPDILSSIYALDDAYPLHNIEDMSLRFDQPLVFPSEIANSMTPTFLDDDHLRFFDPDGSLQPHDPNLESRADLHSAVSSFLYTRSTAIAVDKAKRRWTKISSVLKWFTIRKRVALRKARVPEIHTVNQDMHRNSPH